MVVPASVRLLLTPTIKNALWMGTNKAKRTKDYYPTWKDIQVIQIQTLLLAVLHCCPSLLSSQRAPWKHSDFPACGNCWSARSVLSWSSLTWKGNGCGTPNGVAHKPHRCQRPCATHHQWWPGVVICKTHRFFLTNSAVITNWWIWRGSASSGPLWRQWLVDIRGISPLSRVYVICQAGPPPVKRC